MAVAGIVLGIIGCLLTVMFLLPAYRSARWAARQAMCANNLKQIGLAFSNYQEAHGCLPPAAITDRNGRPLLSWRVGSSLTWNRARSTRNSTSTSPGTVPTTSPCSSRRRRSTPAPATATESPG